MNEYDYTGDKTKNYFTAYLQKCIRWKRYKYLKEKEKISNIEDTLEEENLLKYGMTVDEMLEQGLKEELLFREQEGEYPEWDKLTDKKLVESLLMLREEERFLIYQHVFEEKTFKEIARLNGMAEERIKGVYYYAIRKIRKWMRGKR